MNKVKLFQDEGEDGHIAIIGDMEEILKFIGSHQPELGKERVSFEHRGNKRANTKVVITSVSPSEVSLILSRIR